VIGDGAKAMRIVAGDEEGRLVDRDMSAAWEPGETLVGGL
jgi:hypothetical protein